MENKDKPAFATNGIAYDEIGSNGLTKRELIAAMAMQGMLANPKHAKDSTPWYNKILQWFFPKINRISTQGNLDDIARVAISQADELITQLNNSK